MALINTGLGWAADEDFVKQYAGAIGHLTGLDGGTSFPGQPIGAAPSGTGIDVVSNGYMWCETEILEHYYAAANIRDNVYVFVYKSSGRYYYVAVSTVQCAVYRCTRRKSDGVISDPILSAVASGSAPTYYDEHFVSGGAYTDSTIIAPRFASRNAGLAALTPVTENVYKLGDGYCTGIWARFAFHAVPNVYYVTPVIISSDPDYAEFSLDQISAAGEYHAYTYQGMSFTMGVSLQYRSVSVTNPAFPYRDLSGVTISTLADLFNAAARIVSLTVTSPEQPYDTDPTEPGGGPTEPDDADDIPFAVPPYITASSSGFVRIFNPTLSEINSLASFMWSSGFDLDTLKRVYANPIDYIIGASIVPVIPSVKTASYPITFPGLAGSISSGVSMDEVYQYVTINCGSISVAHKWNSYLDYSPYHRFQIWLPYIGFRDLDADDIMGRTIELQYLVDLLSGACNAELLCGGSVLYSWQGQCGAQIPINSADWSSMFTGAISLAASAVKMGTSIATGGATASSLVTDIASAGASAFNLKPSISRGGTVAGAAGFMAQQVPYIVRTRPELAIPADLAHYAGYPSFTTVSLGSLTGYAEVYSTHLHDIPATDTELTEIEQILKGGVIY